MKRMLVALGLLGLVCMAAQAPAAKPGPELKKLDVWSPCGTERKLEGTGQGRWMGDSFLVFNSKGKDADGREVSALFIHGYDPAKKEYVAQGFRSDGWRGTAVATFGDEALTYDWTGVTANGEKTRTRRTFRLSAPDKPETCENFTDGKWWVSVKGKASVVRWSAGRVGLRLGHRVSNG